MSCPTIAMASIRQPGDFSNTELSNQDLRRLSSASSGGNGMYAYGSERNLPDQQLQRDELLRRRRVPAADCGIGNQEWGDQTDTMNDCR